MKDWRAFGELKRKLEEFHEICPLLEMMSNDAMKDRHWKRLEELTSHKFDVEAEGFQLKNILEAPLLQYKEDIEVLYNIIPLDACYTNIFLYSHVLIVSTALVVWRLFY